MFRASVSTHVLIGTMSHSPEAPAVTKLLIGIRDLSQLTGTSENTIRYWIKYGNGGPPFGRLGRRIVFKVSDVEEWINSAFAA